MEDFCSKGIPTVTGQVSLMPQTAVAMSHVIKKKSNIVCRRETHIEEQVLRNFI